ncbi:hypothetical protein NYO99_03440 [Pelomonas sp. UHG3]|uniref:Uncharacterized protein n=1 Tax=Roseateles hydrophilus TaxID=2975054 RepID=A0ACC6C6E7_9BURK|nr:hypothetical protein [Pelomonas sp. UHG3]MCY4744018.1 hypothetical protein [Pelomonas sp. UHG3]
MKFEQELASLKQRIARAERACDHWRTAGEQEQYMQACTTVSALDLQLDRLYERQHVAEDHRRSQYTGDRHD